MSRKQQRIREKCIENRKDFEMTTASEVKPFTHVSIGYELLKPLGNLTVSEEGKVDVIFPYDRVAHKASLDPNKAELLFRTLYLGCDLYNEVIKEMNK